MPTSLSCSSARIERARTVLGLFLIGVVLSVGAPEPAAAHAIVRSTTPEADATVERPPEQVVMRFNEPVEIAFGAIRVFDGAGRRVDVGHAEYVQGGADAVAVALRPELADGTYTVSWRVLSADSHPIQEAYVFHVGAPGTQPEGVLGDVLAGESGAGPLAAILLGVTRWLVFAGLLVLIGAAVFLVVAWDRGPTPPPDEVEAVFRGRWRRTVVAAWTMLVVATAASIALQGAVAANVRLLEALRPTMLRAVLDTRFGQIATARLLILLALAGAAAVLTPRLAGARRVSVGVGAATQPPVYPRGTAIAGVLVATALAATPALAGHAGTVEPLLVNVTTDTLHVLAAAAWIGGLIVLLLAVFPATIGLPDHERAQVMAPAVARFSNVAMVAVAVLVATGVYRSWAELGDLDALFRSSYGVTLLVKLGVFVPLLALGGVNNRWVRPRLQRAVSDPRAQRALPLLRRTVTTEVTLAVVVLAVTAVLVNLPPGRTATDGEGPNTVTFMLGDDHAELLVDPSRVGENTVTVMLPEPQGHDAAFEDLELRFTMPARGIGPLVADADPIAPHHFVVQQQSLSVPGTWEIEIVGQVDRFTDVPATVSVHIQR